MRRLLLIVVSAALAAVVLAPAGSASAASANANQRVIVELAIPADSTAEQITAAGDAVLALLEAGSYEVTNRYTTIPYINLTVSPAALGVLNTSPLVAKVHNDGSVNASPSTQATPAVAAKPAAKKCKKGKSKAAKKKYKKCVAAQKKQKAKM